jgi:hypothetical protein
LIACFAIFSLSFASRARSTSAIRSFCLVQTGCKFLLWFSRWPQSCNKVRVRDPNCILLPNGSGFNVKKTSVHLRL